MSDYRAYLIQPVSEQVTFTADEGADLVEAALTAGTITPHVGDNWDLDGDTDIHYIEDAATCRRVYGEGADDTDPLDAAARPTDAPRQSEELAFEQFPATAAEVDAVAGVEIVEPATSESWSIVDRARAAR